MEQENVQGNELFHKPESWLISESDQRLYVKSKSLPKKSKNPVVLAAEREN